MGEPATPTVAGTSTASPTNYASLTLAQLRDKAKITANPNEYSSRSWIQNAFQTAEQAKQDDARGLNEKAFVGYLKACQFFQAFLSHRDYPTIKADGTLNVSWFPYIEFSQKRAEYLARARTLSEGLKDRPVEVQNGAAAPHTSTELIAPKKEQTQPPTAHSADDEPDVSAGGSIAARMAALRGAGMQVGVAKRTNKDVGALQSPINNAYIHAQSSPTINTTPNTTPSQYVTANGQTPLSATNSSGFPAANGGSSGSRRSSVSSITNQFNQGQPPPPLAPPPAPGQSNSSGNNGSRRGSIASITTPQNNTAGASINSQTTGGSNPPCTPKTEFSSYLDNNKTGSSTRSFDRYSSQNQPSSLPSPRINTVSMGSNTQLTTHTTSGSPSAAPGSSTRALPLIPNHYYRGSAPHNSVSSDTAPTTTTTTTTPPSSSSYASGFTAATPRARQNTSNNGGFSTGAKAGKPEVIQEDDEEMAYFSSAFPPLSEFEDVDGQRNDGAPTTAMHGHGQGQGRNGEAEGNADGGAGALFPSAPRNRPGDISVKLRGASMTTTGLADTSRERANTGENDNHTPSGGFSGLLAPDVIQRPSSLPMPDTARATSQEKSYFPSPPGSSGLPSTPKESNVNPPPPILLPSPSAVGLGSARSTKPPLPPIPGVKPKTLSPTTTTTTATQKPTLPLTNSISPEVLYDYFQEPSLALLVIDTRPYEDHQRDYIGKEPVVEGRKMNTIWIDPTILARPGLDSIKLENALSLLPAAEHKAFLNRQQNDLVVLYDAASTAFPKTGSRPTAPGILFSIIFENEFRKSLPRSPVLLIGGFQAWRAEVELRRKGERNARDANVGYRAVAKGPPPVVSSKPTSQSSQPESNESPDSRAVRRETGVYRSSGYSRNITDNFNAPYPQSMAGLGQGYNGQPMIPNSMVSATLRSSQPSAYSKNAYTGATAPTPPPLASTSPGPLSRKRSDYVDQHNQAYSGYQNHTSRPSMDYPQIGVSSIPQPPPAAATSSSERQESRPRADRSASIISFDGLSKLPESDDMMYWNDVALGISGLKNLGNTCYMNSTLQCLSATYPLARFFRDGSYKRAINTVNPMGTKGDLAKAFATLISVLWNEQYTFLSPVTFRKSISTYAPSFAGTDQHDSQEFLSFLLDGLHEDLNRIRTKPPPVDMSSEREAALETLPPSVAAEKEWQIYKQRNDSLIVDLFQGQYRNRMECLTCHKTSTTYDAFMYLSLPVPQGKQKVVLYQLIDNFVQTEVMENDDAWNCPRCKVPRKATKSLSIARLPPVLLIHLKRFTTTNGVFWDKSETPVIFPVKHLDLTRYIPPSPAQLDGKHPSGPVNPMSSTGPFLYDLFAISNHMGSLSNGHYTAFVNSSKGWQYCDDSKVTRASEGDVVSKPAHAYILWYKRTLPPRTNPATAA
ncbi:hypothetical protein QFC21_002629 [Naganishia friedmannii]|uniref:Uncharacterized protein n=1 Tax=Naganishia friedmannii TaxID=89922 RepID=A0ACC2VVQ3_9TREE|nr:hypothetical protein QFC21_002629 [Naganishia friedmannii]